MREDDDLSEGDVEVLDCGAKRRIANLFRTRRRPLALALLAVGLIGAGAFAVIESSRPSPSTHGNAARMPHSSNSVPIAGSPASSIPQRRPSATLASLQRRPLHFPILRPGQSCPTTPGHRVSTSEFGGVALGTGSVQPTLPGPDSKALRGTGDLLTHTQYPPWLALSTVWFSLPSYEGPWLVRAQRLDATGPIGMGDPEQTMIFVQAATDQRSGYRIQ